jgi:phosphonate transport system substrate-binding protein
MICYRKYIPLFKPQTSAPAPQAKVIKFTISQARLIDMTRITASVTTLLTLCLLAACTPESTERPLQYSSTPTATSIPVYRLAIHPLYNPQKLSQAYQPLVDHLNGQIPGVQFELEASRDYHVYEQKFRNREPAFLLPNPWQTLQAIKAGYHVFAMAGDAEDFKGLFIVRRDSGIKSPDQLIGKSVSYPSPTALAAAIMPQYFLHTQGININRDIKNVYVGSQESSIMNVYLGKVAAAATWPPPWRLFQKTYPEEAAQLTMIWETPSLINNAVMARDDVPEDIRIKVQQALTRLQQTSEGKGILSGMETSRFLVATDDNYDIVREYIKRFEKEVRPVEAK